jgi:hypothetical protein
MLTATIIFQPLFVSHSESLGIVDLREGSFLPTPIVGPDL